MFRRQKGLLLYLKTWHSLGGGKKREEKSIIRYKHHAKQRHMATSDRSREVGSRSLGTYTCELQNLCLVVGLLQFWRCLARNSNKWQNLLLIGMCRMRAWVGSGPEAAALVNQSCWEKWVGVGHWRWLYGVGMGLVTLRVSEWSSCAFSICFGALECALMGKDQEQHEVAVGRRGMLQKISLISRDRSWKQNSSRISGEHEMSARWEDKEAGCKGHAELF